MCEYRLNSGATRNSRDQTTRAKMIVLRGAGPSRLEDLNSYESKAGPDTKLALLCHD